MRSETHTRFNIKISGSGEKVMLLAHGLGCDQTMWRFITPAFESDYKIVLFDFLGSGNSKTSEYSPGNYPTLNEYADDLLEIIEALQLSEIVFVGHSVGSMIGMLASIKQPNKFKHLIMVNPSPSYLNTKGYAGGFEKNEIETLLHKLKENLGGWSAAYAPVIMGNTDRPALSNELKESFRSTDHAALYNFAQLTFNSDLRDELVKVEVPTLILQGNEDVIAPRDVGEYLHERIPTNELIVLNATGHCAHLSEPAETVNAIKSYLSTAES